MFVAGLILSGLLAAAPAVAQIKGEVVASGLSDPVAFVPDPAFNNVFYIVERGGLVRTLRDGVLQPTPFADLRAFTQAGGERGLLGMAFATDASGRVFFNYTDANGHTVVSRFQRTPLSPLQVDPGSKFDLLWPGGERLIRQPLANHNGGHLAFGPDGRLYIGLGDGGGSNDPDNNAQNPSSLLGKMLRLDVSVADSDTVGYRVPADNPFVTGLPVAAHVEIWAFGLRNPWRYSFDDLGSGATGALVIGDVGEGAREEINFEPRGAGGRNYGWRIREGRIPTPGVPPTAPAYGPLVDPTFDYAHTQGRAVIGGFVYRGTALGASFRGRYFFADFATARVWSLGLAVDPGSGETIVTNVIEHTAELGASLGGVTSFGRDLQGELYLTTFAGNVVKIVADTAAAAPQPPSDPRAIVAGSTVTVSWTAPVSGPVPTSYQLEAGSVPGAADLGVVGTGAGQTSLSFAGIPPGVYFVRLRSLGPGGASVPTEELIIVVGGACVGAPPSPTGLAATVLGRTVTLVWTVPSTTDGPTSFVIEAGSSAGLANLALLPVDGSLRSLSVVAPPGQYFVRIRGRNACGTGPVSNEIIVTVF